MKSTFVLGLLERGGYKVSDGDLAINFTIR